MRKFFYILAVLSAFLIGTAGWLLLKGDSTIVARSSPTASWRVEIVGTQRLFGGIEVTANVYTNERNKHSLGVINLLESWSEAEYIYVDSATDKLMIDEVKATFDGRLLIRDRYFPAVNHGLSGEVGDTQIKLPIGEVTRVGFNFMDGTSQGWSSTINVMPKDLPANVQPGFQIMMTPQDPLPQAAFVNATIRHADKRIDRSFALSGKCNLTITITSVTDYVIEGFASISSDEPNIDVAGNFRLVNHLEEHPDIPLKTELVN